MFIVHPCPPPPNYPFSMSCSLYQAKHANPALPEDLTLCVARGFRRYENPPQGRASSMQDHSCCLCIPSTHYDRKGAC